MVSCQSHHKTGQTHTTEWAIFCGFTPQNVQFSTVWAYVWSNICIYRRKLQKIFNSAENCRVKMPDHWQFYHTTENDPKPWKISENPQYSLVWWLVNEKSCIFLHHTTETFIFLQFSMSWNAQTTESCVVGSISTQKMQFSALWSTHRGKLHHTTENDTTNTRKITQTPQFFALWCSDHDALGKLHKTQQFSAL